MKGVDWTSRDARCLNQTDGKRGTGTGEARVRGVRGVKRQG